MGKLCQHCVGTEAWPTVPFHSHLRFTAMTSSKSCSVISRKGAALTMPANIGINQLRLMESH